MDRNALIFANRAEALEKRRADLQREIAESERKMAALTAAYEERLALKRSEGTFGFTHAPTEKELAANARRGREAFRQAFAVGLGFSLLLGLLAMFGL